MSITATPVATKTSTKSLVKVPADVVTAVKEAIDAGLAAVDDTVFPVRDGSRPQYNAYLYAWSIREQLGLRKDSVRIRTTKVDDGYTYAIIPQNPADAEVEPEEDSPEA